jgi:O-antigen/teichoic acid export membrane protein
MGNVHAYSAPRVVPHRELASSVEERSLSSRTLDAFAWRFLSETSKLVLQIAVQVTLARLLPVEAFGLLAVASLVVNLGSRVAEIGTGPALIQRSTISPIHVRVAFTLSAAGGALVTVAIWAGAPFAASLFNVPEVTPVLRLIGTIFVLGGLGTTAEALMLRRMDYRGLLRVELVSYGLGYAVVGIVLALLHYGVWALACATVTQTVLKSAMLFLMSPHPTGPSLARGEVRQLLNFGIGMTLGRLAGFAAQNADYFVVARWLGTTALGLYSRAYQIMCMPIYQFASILNTVLFSAYSTIQHDSERLRRGYLGSLCLSALVVFPMLTTIGILTPELMTGVFGPQWAAASAPLRILCIAGAFYSIGHLADSLVRARGAVYMKFFYNSIYAASVLAGAVVGTRRGITGVAVGVLVATVVLYVLTARLSLRLADARWRSFLMAQLPAAAISVAVLGAGLPVANVLRHAGLHPLTTLTTTTFVCVITAAIAAASMPHGWLSDSVHETIARGKRYGIGLSARLRSSYGAGAA